MPAVFLAAALEQKPAVASDHEDRDGPVKKPILKTFLDGGTSDHEVMFVDQVDLLFSGRSGHGSLELEGGTSVDCLSTPMGGEGTFVVIRGSGVEGL